MGHLGISSHLRVSHVPMPYAIYVFDYLVLVLRTRQPGTCTVLGVLRMSNAQHT